MKSKKEIQIPFTLISLIIAITILGSSFELARYQNKVLMKEIEQRAITVADIILLYRDWVLEYSGIYVKNDSGYNLGQENGFYKKLPPHVIHELSNRFNEKSMNYSFKVTAIVPSNPENMPDKTEKEALRYFENTAKPFSKIVEKDKRSIYYYVMPFIYKENCISCHAGEGVKLNDRSGGLAVKMDVTDYTNLVNKNYLSNLLMGLIIALLIIYLIHRAVYLRIEKRISDYENLAKLDGLTGVYNHSTFMDAVEHLTKEGINNFAVILIDLDDFKNINDTFGHQAGDFVLRETAALFKSELRDSDVIARYGGEEFAIILPNSDKQTVYIVAERIKNKLKDSIFEFNDNSIKLTCSMGISYYPENAENKEMLIKHADDNLYKAKNNGKNQIYLTS